MLKLIFSIGDLPEDLTRFEINLENILPDIPPDVELICLGNENLKDDALSRIEKILSRGIRNVTAPKEIPVTYIGIEIGESVSAAKEFVRKNDLLFICNGRAVFPSEGLKKLLEDSERNPRAGVISGYLLGEPPYYRVKDVYADKLEWTHAPLLVNKLVRIDAIPFYGLITRGREFLHYFNDNEVEYCVKLRRMGYENLLDARVRNRAMEF